MSRGQWLPVRVLGFSVSSHLVVDVCSEEEDTVLGKARIDVHLALTHGNHRHGDAGLGRAIRLGRFRHHRRGSPNLLGARVDANAGGSSRAQRHHWARGRESRGHSSEGRHHRKTNHSETGGDLGTQCLDDGFH